MPFQKLSTKPKAYHVAEQIMLAIRQDTYKIGERLPPESEIASEIGVSRPVVREALGALRLLGVVDARPGLGTFVRSVPNGLDVQSVLTSPQNPFEALEARACVEPAIARRVLHAISSERLLGLRQNVESMRNAIGRQDTAALAAAERSFHLGLAEASGNTLLHDFVAHALDVFWESGIGAGLGKEFYLEEKYALNMARIHESIVECISRQDSNGLEETFRLHFVLCERQLIGGSSV